VTSPTRRFALPFEDSFLSLLMYIDSRGNVSADFLEGSISNFGVTGSQVAFNGDDDRFVINVADLILVIRRDGGVFAHAVRQIPPTPIASGPLRIMPPVACSGSRVAFNGDVDRFVARMFERRIIVVRRDGAVFGHDIIPDGDGAFIQPPFAFTGSKVAFNGEEGRFVVGMFSQIIVIRRDGAVFGHDTTADNRILPPFAFSGSKVAFNGEDDQFVVTMGTTNTITAGPQNCIVVVRRDGGLLGHTVQGRTISPPFEVRLRPPS
jgi:hypothetical protein